MQIVSTNTVDTALWDDFVQRHPLGTIYHHSLWQKVIQKTYGFQPFYHLILDHHSKLQAALPLAFVKSWVTGNRIVSYPFSDTCDPLVGNSGELEALVKAAWKSRVDLNARFVELRLAKAYQFLNGHHCYSDYLTHRLALSEKPEVLFRSFHKSCIQRAINKAQKENVQIVTGKTKQDLRLFYRLHVMTREKQGVPVQPYRFFRNLWEAFAPEDMITLLLARHQDRMVAGMVVLWFNGIAYYKFGASDENFLSLRANQLLMWETIQLAEQKGCQIVDFGRTSVANKGLIQYKSRWGTRQLAVHHLRLPNEQRCDLLNESSYKHTMIKRVMARMPVFVLRVIGELCYRHFA